MSGTQFDAAAVRTHAHLPHEDEWETARMKQQPSPKGYFQIITEPFGLIFLYFCQFIYVLVLTITALIHAIRHKMLFMPLNSASCVEQVQSLADAGEDYKKSMPKHICLALLEDKLNFEDISRMAVWCHALGTRYISFYDPFGTLMSSPNVLEDELEKKLFECRISKDELIFLQPGEKYIRSYADSEGSVARILDLNDGQKKTGDVIGSILNEAISHKGDSSSNIADFSVAEIEGQLAVAGENFPDPECVICFSKIESTIGLLPWQLNHSEFIRVPSHHGIQPSQFLHALERYCKIEKRFGK